ncbi:helix-turn-helix domain-containing protein [Lutimonas halocynthiae]|uniref:helix-turn-helix domain-containing protein n=1 Tax=Lutimonas halocynthiae TaxID=1446477 RepID=UPI0025B2BCE5|nr:helix-turn-helix domain-containing protein [Lutimonas halocynthiae]MDN3643037.1 helix-turn-helix domain-containing protein [Lutimonas halocynthiae]
MKEIVEISTVNDYCAAFNKSALHPLVSVLDLSEGSWPSTVKKVEAVRYHFYGVFLKQGQNCVLQYGRQNYDYQDGTLVFIGPGQVVNISHIDYNEKPSGYALLFHPDLLRGSNLGKHIDGLSFFSYQLREALHLSEKERQIVLDCFDKIQFELSQGLDKHSKKLIVANIELFLSYCTRFYDRQFITRDTVNLGIVKDFESALNSYIKTGKAKEQGTPSVNYFAAQQHLSANYFGDLVKKETGKSAHEFIQAKIIEVAKEKIFDPTKSLSEIAYELGFKYPQHFTRLFKNKVGYSPNEFRKMN